MKPKTNFSTNKKTKKSNGKEKVNTGRVTKSHSGEYPEYLRREYDYTGRRSIIEIAITYKIVEVVEPPKKPYEAIDKSDMVNPICFIMENRPRTKMCRYLHEWIFNPNNTLNIHPLLIDYTVRNVENHLEYSRTTNDRELELVGLSTYNVTKSYVENMMSTNEWIQISKFVVKNLYSLAEKVVDTRLNNPSLSIHLLQQLLKEANVSIYHSGIAIGILILTVNNERLCNYQLSKIAAGALYFALIILDGKLSHPFDIAHLWTSKLESASTYTASNLLILVQLFAIFAGSSKRPEFARFYKHYKNEKQNINLTDHESGKNVSAMYREIIKIESLTKINVLSSKYYSKYYDY